MLKYLPKLLLIDMTSMEGPAATSSLKRAYFGDWRENGFLHVRSGGRDRVLITALDGNETILTPDAAGARHLIDAFKPDLILYRPVADHKRLHEAAMHLIAQSDAPVVTWLMDDWPERLRADTPAQAAAMDSDLRQLFARSALNLAISDGMAKVFRERYGCEFEVAHNGVVPEAWQAIARVEKAVGPQRPLRVRYAGSLAPDTTHDSVMSVARAVSRLAERGVDICFEGHTQTHWYEKFADQFNALSSVSVQTSNLAEQDYRAWLSQADIVLLAYNFDEDTKRYLQYSFANKMPELLASGAPLLAYGPLQLETMAYLHRNDLGEIVSEERDDLLEQALMRLIDSPDLRASVGQKGQAHAFAFFDFTRSKDKLISKLGCLVPREPNLVGQVYPREAGHQLDECSFISDLLDASHNEGVMIDVGAHVGGSLQPFARAGWSVFAFEPDELNRSALLAAVADFPKVHVSPQAVGAKAQAEAAFYRSDLSSGISSLSAFHESHEAANTVAVTTLDHLVREAGLTQIDFLKVDVEGHEMDVLNGFDLGHVRPKAIMLEFEDGKAERTGQSSLKALAERLIAHDYHVYVSEWHSVIQYGLIHEWRQFAPYPAALAKSSWGNLIAFADALPPEALEVALRRNISGGDAGLTALSTLSHIASKPSVKQRILTLLAQKAPWLRALWRSLKRVARR